jgi:uncharacterized protein YjiS (DUF1127 family)
MSLTPKENPETQIRGAWGPETKEHKMAHYTDISRTAGTGLISVVRNMFEGIRLSFARQRAFTTTYNQLDALSDHELADIGLSRGDILDIARETAARI